MEVKMAAPDDVDNLIKQFHLAVGEFLKGNPEPNKELFSHREDVTIANPYGPPVRGWEQVARVIERASLLRRDGELVSVEIIGKYVTPELAYVVEIEHARAKVGGREDVTPYDLRATMVFRPEDGVWKIMHRHADPITTTQPAESVVKK
jgi:ketosteroid isomerase-like protein